jgi:hypothetical protein
VTGDTVPGDGEGEWYDEAAGPLVRPYAMTRGRVRPGRAGLDLMTLVLVDRRVVAGGSTGSGSPERTRILDMCTQPVSIAELASRLDVPVVVVKVLVSDLLERGLVVVGGRSVSRSDVGVLRAVLDGVRRL